MSRKIQRYGWIPDVPDHRDLVFSAPQPIPVLPLSVDLRPGCPPVYNQGQLGSCTANAIGAAHQYNQMKQTKSEIFIPSRLFIYYNERVMEGTINVDAGAQIRDGIKSIAKQGVCPESEWGYDVSLFKKKPLKECYKHALDHQAILYYSVSQSLVQLKTCLASGFPIIFGFAVYESFESQEVAKTGIAPMPAFNEKMMGGHAVTAVGYDDATSRFLIRNSWGEGWGQKGCFTMPYDYLINSNLACDFWAIKLVE